MLIDCAPKPELLSGAFHDDLIQMPDIAGAGLSSSQVAGDPRAEFDDPTAGGLIGYINFALEEHFLNFTQVQIEQQVKPDGVSNERIGKRDA